MGNFSELSSIKQWGILAVAAALLTGVLYFTVFNSQQSDNAAAQRKLDDKLRENAELEKYRTKLDDIERQLASLKQQLAVAAQKTPQPELQIRAEKAIEWKIVRKVISDAKGQGMVHVGFMTTAPAKE